MLFQKYALYSLAVAIPLSILAMYEMRTAEGSAEHDFAASIEAREHEVSFDAVFFAPASRYDELSRMSAAERDQFTRWEMLPLMDYLFGPLTERQIGSPQRVHKLQVDWSHAKVEGKWTKIPYTYSGVWLVNRLASSERSFQIPVPYNMPLQQIEGWKLCTDSAPDHQTRSFYWYFWDPARQGCQLKEGVHYQTVEATLGRQTPNRENTRPETARLQEDGELSMTIAFGYVEDPDKPNPPTNSNAGAGEYRRFLQAFERSYGQGFTKEPITLADYPATDRTGDLQIGTRYTGKRGDLRVKVNIVMSAGIDQMDLFAKSYAHDDDDIFMWFGHSRVGSGFDAQRFTNMLSEKPDYFHVSPKYQIIYWGGCNSYSYYTLPFFDLKAALDPAHDPEGTRNLDIIANGLPSMFALNAKNAMIATRFFFEPGQTYFELTKQIEGEAKRFGTTVLAIVMGDEDNGG